MNTELYELKTNIKIGQEIFEKLPNDIRPGWAGLILSRFDAFIKNNPPSVTNLFSIIGNKDRWKEVHQQFNQIRTFALSNKDYEPANYLRLAELVAKVTYNASGLPAPFDSDSGHYIASLSLQTAAYFNDTRLEEEVRSAILLFSINKAFQKKLTTGSDFLLYKKLTISFGMTGIHWVLTISPRGMNTEIIFLKYLAYLRQTRINTLLQTSFINFKLKIWE